MKATLFFLLAIIVAGVAWFLLSPLFIDQRVDEPFVLVDEQGTLNSGDLMQMPPEKLETMRDEIMDAAAQSLETVVNQPMPEGGPRALRRGEFRDGDPIHEGSDTATLYRLGTDNHLLRFEDFTTTNGPQLVVYLSKHPDPRTADDVHQTEYLELGTLKGNVGNQNYELPPGTPVDEYQSVVIWCELFDVLFSPAPLQNVTL